MIVLRCEDMPSNDISVLTIVYMHNEFDELEVFLERFEAFGCYYFRDTISMDCLRFTGIRIMRF